MEKSPRSIKPDIARIEAVDARINSLPILCFESVLKQARYLNKQDPPET